MKQADVKSKLVSEARRASANAYCPYSGFAVGAALLAKDGRIFSAANVENASYGLTICAERGAVVAAISAGARRFEALAVVGGSDDEPAYPCGACLQVLSEFCASDMPIFVAPLKDGPIEETSLHRLLPRSFTLKKFGPRWKKSRYAQERG